MAMIRIGRGEEKSGGRTKPSLLSNVFEAVVGAYYLDSGLEAVRDWLEPLFEKIVNDLPTTDPRILSALADCRIFPLWFRPTQF